MKYFLYFLVFYKKRSSLSLLYATNIHFLHHPHFSMNVGNILFSMHLTHPFLENKYPSYSSTLSNQNLGNIIHILCQSLRPSIVRIQYMIYIQLITLVQNYSLDHQKGHFFHDKIHHWHLDDYIGYMQ